IGADALRVERLPINPPGAFKDVASAEGRVPVADLGEGTPLLEGQLVSGLALHVQDGERAIAVKADEANGVGNRVRPGDFVDVFFVLKSDGKDVEHTQARLLLPRARVLAFGSTSLDHLPPTKPVDAKAANAQAARPEAARTAVLAVPVMAVNRIALAESAGRLQLALRNPTDTAVPDPALFAELPTALRPRVLATGTAAQPALQGIDVAQAGLRASDLADGGSANVPRSQAARTVNVATPVRAVRSATPVGGTEFEIIRGDRRETATY
ncbi:MAG: Flp pilus assembly protein CpaB, partial [Variovorax sp.]